MAMTIKTEGIEELDRILGELKGKAMDVAKASLYDGAGIVANAYAAAANSIRTEPFKGKREKRMPSPEEKAALVGRTGIARFKETGEGVDTLIGITGADGYVQIGGKAKAVRLIARSINSGTSFMDKQPVFRKAKNAAQGAAKAAIVAKAEKMYDEIINGSGL
jgi:hypothetical protein